MSVLSKFLLALVGIVFLLKGGFAMVIALWRVLLPLALVAGGIYLVKGYLADKKKLQSKPRPKSVPEGEGAVIQICPHCLQEMGSCPHCRR